jgi:hypothetical protein
MFILAKIQTFHHREFRNQKEEQLVVNRVGGAEVFTAVTMRNDAVWLL